MIACCGLFLAWQIALPTRLLFADSVTVNKDFSWDMFSHDVSCSEVAAEAVGPSGERIPVSLRDDFSSFVQVRRILFSGVIERYASQVCSRLRPRYGAEIQLFFHASCRDGAGPEREFVDPARDYCRRAR